MEVIKIALICENYKQHEKFYEAWDIFTSIFFNSPFLNEENELKVCSASVTAAYIAEFQKEPLSEYFSFEVAKRHNPNITILSGNFNQQDHRWINILIHHRLIKDTILFDAECVGQQSPMPIEIAEYCQNPEWDQVGMSRDLFKFFFGKKGDQWLQQKDQENIKNLRSVS
jgi:hypothetical protein